MTEAKVEITVSGNEGSWRATCEIDEGEWAEVHAPTRIEAVRSILHYALVHLSGPAPDPLMKLIEKETTE